MKTSAGNNVAKWGLSILVFISLFAAVANFNYHQRVLDRMDLARSQSKEITMDSITSTWVSGGVEISVTTSTNQENWREIHKDKVSQAMEDWPKDE